MIISSACVWTTAVASTSEYRADMARTRLVTTGELARELGLHSRTLQRYRAEGSITPELESRGGHARWDVEKVKEQLRALRQRDE